MYIIYQYFIYNNQCILIKLFYTHLIFLYYFKSINLKTLFLFFQLLCDFGLSYQKWEKVNLNIKNDVNKIRVCIQNYYSFIIQSISKFEKNK